MLQLLGLALSAIIIIGVIVLGVTTGIGLVLAVPLFLVALTIPLLVFRGRSAANRVQSTCPYCGSAIKTPDHIAELSCPACGNKIEIRDRKLLQAK